MNFITRKEGTLYATNEGMEDIFKQKLLRLRAINPPRTFTDLLFGSVPWFAGQSENKINENKNLVTFSERNEVLKSLENFAEDKFSANKTQIIKFEGGEIAKKNTQDWINLPVLNSIDDLKTHLKMDQTLESLILKDKNPGRVSVVFVTEKFRPTDDIQKDIRDGFMNELLATFVPKTAEFFEKMIKAMKLNESEVATIPVETADDKDFSHQAMTIACFFKPEVIITLGSSATSRVLKSDDRLTVIHGQFFNRHVGDHKTLIVPLFHPSIIETNQNMKRTAWSDMQKIMKFLKKIP